MKRQQRKRKPKTRNDWGNIKPYTKIEKVKTKYNKKIKHKNKEILNG